MDIETAINNKKAYLNRDLSKLKVKKITSIDEARRLENLQYVLRNISMKNLKNNKDNEEITNAKSNRSIR